MTAPRILVAGIGGIGGVLAARLVRAGYGPTLLTHNAAITDAILREGLRITDPRNTFSVPARAYTTLDEVPQPDEGFAAAYLVMKADAAVEAARAIAPRLGPTGYVVTFQNGIVEDAVAEAIGAERVVSGIVGFGATMHGPGLYEQTGPGDILVGELDGQDTKRLGELAQVLRSVGPVVVSPNIRGALWTKLTINCTITTLGALTGQTLGTMLADRRVRLLFLRVYQEVVDTATALGIRLERIAAPPTLLYLPRDANWLHRQAKDLLVQLVGRKYARLKSSSLQSLERGRKTEVDFLNGYVVAKAAPVGVATPVNAALVELIHDIEAGRRPIGPDNVCELIRRTGCD